MKTTEEILTDELSEDHVYILNTTPKLKDWIIDAMKIYANQKLDDAKFQLEDLYYDFGGDSATPDIDMALDLLKDDI